MQELITRIEKLNPHPTEVITLFYDFDNVNIVTISEVLEGLLKKISRKYNNCFA